MTDNSPSVAISVLLFASHIFRMSLFFFVAGFFARMMFERRGARGFWGNRAKRILVPLLAGWVVIFPAIAGVWIWGLTKTFGGTLPAPPANAPPAAPGAFPLTHLWFLYYLLVLYVVVLLVRRIIVAIDRRGVVRRAADSAGARRRAKWRRGGAARSARGRGPVLSPGLDHVVRDPDARSIGHSAMDVGRQLRPARRRLDGSSTVNPI